MIKSLIRLCPLRTLMAFAVLQGAATCFGSALQDRADRFLALVNAGYQALYKVDSEAQWLAKTDVTPAHDGGAEVSGKALAAFCGSPAVIREARELLAQRKALKPITVRQLEKALWNAAEGPMTNPDLVVARVTAETRQSSALNAFEFKLSGKTITANEIDNLLDNSTNLVERLAVWDASKQSGPALKPGLIRLQGLRNGVARELGYADYFSLQASKYGLSADEMVRLQEGFMRDLKPLYLQLHTWVKHELAKKYGRPVPQRIPAHWINDRWSQNWNGLIEAADLNPFMTNRSAEWIVKTSEQFWTGLGFPKLPGTFWDRSDLYPLKPGDSRKKNTHASCWHVDLQEDIRSLMSVEPNAEWFTTSHHELGHAYYFVSYTLPGVPYLLRDSANPGFHEAMAELGGFASGMPAYLKAVGVLPADRPMDGIASLLDDALANSVPFIFWASGTMTHWEADLYARNLKPDEWNARWWRYVRDFQGVEPPTARGEEFCDAATKTHINDTPAYYPAYAVATVLKFQLHEHIARKILRQPLQQCSYANNREVGGFLRGIMSKGLTEDWRSVLRKATGEELSTRAMMEYYRPLMGWLEEQNRGRQIGWD